MYACDNNIVDIDCPFMNGIFASSKMIIVTGSTPNIYSPGMKVFINFNLSILSLVVSMSYFLKAFQTL